MYLALRRWVPGASARFVGGLVYGFSPFAVGHLLGGHVFMILGWLPPLILVLLDEALIRQRASPRKVGIALGVALSAQLFIAEEIVAESALLGTAAVAVLAAMRRSEVRRRVRYGVRSLLWALTTGAAICGWPIYEQLRGPAHITGTAQPVSSLDFFSADALAFVVPVKNQLLVPHSLMHFTHEFVGGYEPDSTAYVGLPAAVLVMWAVFSKAMPRHVRFFAIMTGIAALLSAGPRLLIDGHHTPVLLPFAIVRHIPLLDSSMPARYAQFVALFLAAVTACALDHIRKACALWKHKAWVAPLAAAVVAAVLVAPLLPRWPPPLARASIPTFFTGPGIRTLPAGTTTLMYPYPQAGMADPMVWQAMSDFRINLVGGYAVMPDEHGRGALHAADTPLYRLMTQLSAGAPGLESDDRAELRADLCTHGVGALLVQESAAGARSAAAVFEALAGEPVETDGFLVWSSLPPCSRE
jgi:hypothetical protein